MSLDSVGKEKRQETPVKICQACYTWCDRKSYTMTSMDQDILCNLCEGICILVCCFENGAMYPIYDRHFYIIQCKTWLNNLSDLYK